MQRKYCTATLLLFWLLPLKPLLAERYALLIGVSNYPAFPNLRLEGPKEDVPAVQEMLIKTWRYSEANIVSLVDQAATKERILRALDDLVAKVKMGDQVFIYYSGHGTSALDPKNERLGIPLNSGALIPSDVRPGTPQTILNQLIVGVTDLRPRLKDLDAKASIFVVIDSCYSGAAVKSVADQFLASREVPLSTFTGSKSASDDYDAAYSSVHLPAVDPDEYPYLHLVFLSAAAQSEKAYEAKAEALRVGVFRTVDGKPHGLLTDSLLRALRGDADADHDGKITYEEVHRFVYAKVMQQGQTPQLLPKDGLLVQGPIFGVTATQLTAERKLPGSASAVAVLLSPASQWLAPEILKMPNTRVAGSQQADLAIVKVGDNYALHVANGVEIHSYSPSQVDQLLERVRREPQVKRLREWSFDKQAFHANLIAEPGNRDAYAGGEELDFELSADRTSYLLLLNIDVSGQVSIVYKSVAGHPAYAGDRLNVRTCITPPVGMESMKLFAFEQQPSRWDKLELGDFAPASIRFQQLIAFLESVPSNSAETSWLTYSTDRRGPQGRTCPR